MTILEHEVCGGGDGMDLLLVVSHQLAGLLESRLRSLQLELDVYGVAVDVRLARLYHLEVHVDGGSHLLQLVYGGLRGAGRVGRGRVRILGEIKFKE